MAAIGALLAGPLSDKFGRKKSILGSSIIFSIGAIVCGVAFNRWILLLGRMLLGLALGKIFDCLVRTVHGNYTCINFYSLKKCSLNKGSFPQA